MKKPYYIRKQRKKTFDLGTINSRTAHIHMRKTYSNLFVTLTDLKNKVIICRSSGSSGIFRLRKRKSSPYALEKILKRISYHIKYFKIKNLKLFVKMRLNSFSFSLLRYLKFYNVKIQSLKQVFRSPHNGVRARRLPRK